MRGRIGTLYLAQKHGKLQSINSVAHHEETVATKSSAMDVSDPGMFLRLGLVVAIVIAAVYAVLWTAV